MKKGKESKVTIPSVNHFEAVSGKAVLGTVNERTIAVGNDKLMNSQNATFSDKVAQEEEVYQQEGKTLPIFPLIMLS